VLVVVSTLAFAGSEPTTAGSATRRLAQLRAYHGYQLFYLGTAIGSLRLTSVGSDQVPPAYRSSVRLVPKRRVERFDFIYGDCTPSGGGFLEGATCTPPLDIQQLPACALNATVLGSPRRRVRGVPAYWDGDGLVLYTAMTTITIFNDHGLAGALDAARQLRSLNGRHLGAASSLPAPTPFQLQGRERCHNS